MKQGLKCLKCGNVIASYHRHDYRECHCGGCFIDGGDEYFRYGGTNFKVVESPRRTVVCHLLFHKTDHIFGVLFVNTVALFNENKVDTIRFDEKEWELIDAYYNLDESWSGVCA